MTHPIKPVRRPNPEEYNAIMTLAHAHLMRATSEGAQLLGTTGASFVMIGIGLWVKELVELDAKSTSQLLHALAELYDPKSDVKTKQRAEARRRQAADKLFGAVDLDMTPARGSA